MLIYTSSFRSRNELLICKKRRLPKKEVEVKDEIRKIMNGERSESVEAIRDVDLSQDV